MKWPKLAFPKREPREQHGGASLWQFWLLLTVWAFALAGSLWMLVVFIAGSVGRVDWSTGYEAVDSKVTKNTSLFAADVHWSVGGGLFAFCLAIAIYNAVWLELRRHIAPGVVKNALTGIGCAVALFMVSGAIVVQQRGTDAKTQDQVIAAQSAQVGAAGVKAKIDAIDTRLATMRDKRVNNEYAATAANVGVDAYRAQYMNPQILARETPERRRLIERALGAAMTAEQLEAQKLELSAQYASASVLTVKAEAQSVKATGAMASFVGVLEDMRKPVTAMLGELLAMTVFSAALAAWASRAQAQTAPLGEEWQIADQSAEPREEVKSSLRMGRMVDAETGEELVRVNYPQVRRKGKKKQGRQEGQVSVPARSMADDTAPMLNPMDPRISGVSLAPGDVEANNADAENEEARANDDSVRLSGVRSEARAVPTRPDVQMEQLVSAPEQGEISATAQTAEDDHSESVQSSSTAYSDETLNAPQAPPDPEEAPASAVDVDASAEVEAPAVGAADVEPSAAPQAEPVTEELAAEQVAAEPLVLSDDRYDELEAEGVIVDGQFVSQEHQPTIKQDDRATRFPALEDKRVSETEAA